jgi:hypothetical protein
MSAGRDKTQDDFDLDRMITMLDEALMSDDPRVVECLRRLMVTVALTRPESRDRLRGLGPLKQVLDDVRNLTRRLERLEHECQKMNFRNRDEEELDMIKKQMWTTAATSPQRDPFIEERIKKLLEENGK